MSKRVDPIYSEIRERQVDLITSSGDFFAEAVRAALQQRKIETYPHVETYLVGILTHYLDSRNLFEVEKYDELGRKKPQTLAEMMLVANNSDEPERSGTLKKLADRSLYISGFFGESLNRKLVDVDYYVDMGGTAYQYLANCSREDTTAKVYSIFATRFVEFMDALTLISQQSLIKNNESLLRLYDRYLRTGSEMAREKLLEMGVLPVSSSTKK